MLGASYSRNKYLKWRKRNCILPLKLIEKTLKVFSRTLSSWNIEPSRVDTDGHTKLYKLFHGIRVFVRDTMFTCFIKTTDHDSPTRYSAADTHGVKANEWQDVEKE